MLTYADSPNFTINSLLPEGNNDVMSLLALFGDERLGTILPILPLLGNCKINFFKSNKCTISFEKYIKF